MDGYLQQITSFLTNLKAFPVISAVLIMAVFAVIAKISVTSTGRIIKSFCSGKKRELEEKLRQIIYYPIWAAFLLFGVVVTFRWLNLFPSYQFAILGILQTIILLVVALTLNRVVVAVSTFLRDSKDRAFETVSKIENASKFVLFLVCLLFVLAIWKIDLTPLLASAGIAGIVIAVAAKDALSNLIGGLSLALDRPFKTGDYIVLDTGERGKVVGIGARSTLILTRDNVQISVPNSIMANTKVINESAPERRFRIRIKVGVAYGSDIDQVEDTLLKIAVANRKISKFPEPRVRFRAFGDSALELELLCWAKQPKDRGIVVHQMGKAIYQRFQERNITIPFPQQDVHLHQLACQQTGPGGGFPKKNQSGADSDES